MLVHCRVTPQQYVAGTHFIHLGGEIQCGGKVFWLRKQHDSKDWASNYRPSDLKSNALTITPPRPHKLSYSFEKNRNEDNKNDKLKIKTKQKKNNNNKNNKRELSTETRAWMGVPTEGHLTNVRGYISLRKTDFFITIVNILHLHFYILMYVIKFWKAHRENLLKYYIILYNCRNI